MAWEEAYGGAMGLMEDAEMVKTQALYYHGLLSWTQAGLLLRGDGDFLLHSVHLLRTAKTPGELAAALSVRRANKVHHIILLPVVVAKEPSYAVHLSAHRRFSAPSIPSLVGYLWDKGEELHESYDKAVLRRPVGARNWTLLPSQLDTQRQHLGMGEFGLVFKQKVRLAKGDVVAAVKEPARPDSLSEQKDLLDEAFLTLRAQHETVLLVHGLVTLHLPIRLAMELSTYGSLEDLVNKAGSDKCPYSASHLVNWSLDAALALEHLSSLSVPILHRDIAARNYLIMSREGWKRAVLSDFGCAREGPLYTTVPGDRVHVRWAAPEVISDGQCSPASDLWSLGVLIWELFSPPPLPLPYAHILNDEGVGLFLDGGGRLAAPPALPATLADFLLRRIWALSPAERPLVSSLVHKLKAIAPHLR